MKLYLKHIFNSFKSKPFQPLVIIFCIAFSVAVFVSSYVVKDIYYDYSYFKMKASSGSSDIIMKIETFSSTSYMESKTAQEIIGDDGKALGVYETNAFYYGGASQTIIPICMVDFTNELKTFNSIFDVKFRDKGELTMYNINESALISETFADENNIKLKDKIVIGFGNYQLEYTVEGIMEDTSIMRDTNVLVSYKGAIKYFKYNALGTAGAFISENFKPANKIFIKFNDGIDLDKYVSLLLEDSHFSDKEVKKTADTYTPSDSITIISAILTMIAVAFALISVLIIYSSLAVLTAKRTSENSLFMSIGATKKNMAMLIYLECLIYAIFGCAIGIPSSIGISKLFTNLLKMDDFSVIIGWQDILLGIAVGIIVSLLSATISILKTKSISLESQLRGELKRYKKPPVWIIVLFLIISIISAICFAFIPVSWYIYSFAVLFISLTLVVILSVPYVTTSVSKLINIINNKTNRKGISCVAIKNTSVNIGTQNCSRVLCLIISLLTLAIYSYTYALVSVDDIKTAIYGDYAVIGISTDDTKLCDSVSYAESYDFAYLSNDNTLPSGFTIPFMSSEKVSSAILNIDGVDNIKPVGNELYLPENIVKSLSINIGDHLNVKVRGVNTDFVLAGTIPTKLMFGIFDSNYIGYTNNIAIFKKSEDVSEEDFISQLQNTFVAKSISIVRTDEFFKGSIETIVKFLDVVKVLLIFVTILGALGFINSFIDSILNRKEEFSQLKNMGYTKKDIVKMISIECATLFITIILLAAATATIYIFSAQVGLLTYGITFNFN